MTESTWLQFASAVANGLIPSDFVVIDEHAVCLIGVMPVTLKRREQEFHAQTEDGARLIINLVPRLRRNS